jgi:uncharacterized tellurite resistance protein B-like protein
MYKGSTMDKSQLAQHLACLRFDGDANDAATLLDQYGAADTISTLEREHRSNDTRPWDECMAEAIPLSPALTPGIHALVTDACAQLGLDCSIRLFTMSTPQINAYAFLDRNPGKPVLSLCLTSRAMENLSDPELMFLVGHELGHILYEHDRLNILCHTDGNTPDATVLPAMGEWIFWRWRQKAEISADRIGWLLSRNFETGAGAIIKTATGLTSKSLALTADALETFLQENTRFPCTGSLNRQGAPLLQARIQALRLLDESVPKKNIAGDKRPTRLQKADKEVTEILAYLSRHPDTSVGLSCMHLIADAGVELIQLDQKAAADEIKKVLNILHGSFTDEPDKVICMDPVKRVNRLKASIRALNRAASSDEKKVLLSRLADIAMSDGPFREKESKIIVDMAKALRIPQHETYSIIVGCIQVSGKDVDPGVQALADMLATPEAGM